MEQLKRLLRPVLGPPVRLFRRYVRAARIAAAGGADDDLMDKIIERVTSPDSNCIDVGAHRGRFLRTFVRCAPGGQHLAFEPLPDLACEFC